MIDLYAYEDYRLYLKDAFEAKKNADADFSYRRFAEVAGIKNPGYLVDVIKGKRNISPRVLEAAATCFGLSNAEREFLLCLVRFNHADNEDEKAEAYHELKNRRHHSRFVRMNPAHSRYYEDTFYALVLGALQAFDFRGDWEALASYFLQPPAPARLKKAVRELCEWGLLKQKANGRYEVVHAFLEPPATMGALVRRINRQWLHEGADLAMTLPKGERHMSTVLLSVSRETRKKIEAKMDKLRADVLELAKADGEAEELVQLSLLLAPRSKSKSKPIRGKA